MLDQPCACDVLIERSGSDSVREGYYLDYAVYLLILFANYLQILLLIYCFFGGALLV